MKEERLAQLRRVWSAMRRGKLKLLVNLFCTVCPNSAKLYPRGGGGSFSPENRRLNLMRGPRQDGRVRKCMIGSEERVEERG
jgi:hypothetical protein